MRGLNTKGHEVGFKDNENIIYLTLLLDFIGLSRFTELNICVFIYSNICLKRYITVYKLYLIYYTKKTQRTLVVNLQKTKEKETVLKAKEERQITIY